MVVVCVALPAKYFHILHAVLRRVLVENHYCCTEDCCNGVVLQFGSVRGGGTMLQQQQLLLLLPAAVFWYCDAERAFFARKSGGSLGLFVVLLRRIMYCRTAGSGRA